MSDVREQNVQKPDEGAVPPKVPKSSPNLAAAAKEEDDAFTFLDVLRTSIFLLLTSMAVSWLVNRDVSWGLQRPDFMRYDVVKTWIVCPRAHIPFPPPLLQCILTLSDRPQAIHRRGPGSLRRHRRGEAHLPSHQRHHLRRVKRQEALRTRGLIPLLRGRRRLARLRDELLC